MTRVAAVDCGTNSIRLLVADIDSRGRLVDVCREGEVVRLGQGVDRTGRLDPERIDAALAMSREYAEQCRTYAVDAVRFVATSASRDASNAGDFVTGVERRLRRLRCHVPRWSADPTSKRPTVLLRARRETCIAAEHQLALPRRRPRRWARRSSCAASESGGRRRSRWTSALCGSPSGTCAPTRPPTHEIASRPRADVDAALDKAVARRPDLARASPPSSGLAGSVTTVTAHAAGACRPIDPERIHLSRLQPGPDHIAAADGHPGHDVAPTGARLCPTCIPGRVDVIGGGVLGLATCPRARRRGLARCRRGHLGARHPRRHRPVARPLSLSPPHPDHVEREQIAGPATAGPRFAPSRRGRGRAGHRVGRATRQPSTGQRLFSSAH
jgi:exopolyphosphatase/guanosine-5'-triphosphate,3'-diphosphate pyrophosphatase